MDDVWETVSRSSARPSTASEYAAAQQAPAAAQGATRGSPSPPRARSPGPFEAASRYWGREAALHERQAQDCCSRIAELNPSGQAHLTCHSPCPLLPCCS